MLATILGLLAENGIGLVCLGVILFDHFQFQQKLQGILDSIGNRLIRIESKLNIEEDDEK